MSISLHDRRCGAGLLVSGWAAPVVCLVKWRVGNKAHRIWTSHQDMHHHRLVSGGRMCSSSWFYFEQKRTWSCAVPAFDIILVSVWCCQPGSTSMDAPVWRTQVPPAHREQIPPLHRHIPAGRAPADEVHPQAERRHQRTRFRGWTEAVGGARCLGCGGPKNSRQPRLRAINKVGSSDGEEERRQASNAGCEGWSRFQNKSHRHRVSAGALRDELSRDVSRLHGLELLGGIVSTIAIYAVLYVRINCLGHQFITNVFIWRY